MPSFERFSARPLQALLQVSRPSVLRALLAASLLAACGGTPDVNLKPGRDGSGAEGGETGSGTGGSGSRPIIVDPGDGGEAGGGGEPDPCEVPSPPPECFEIGPSGPACGDGELNQPSERCDDGNSLPGDGCSGVCTVEPYWECPRPGRPCRITIACGDGVKDPGEVCDDGNTDDDDGCSADCAMQDPSYVCTTPGEPCILLFRCGDSRVNGSETCDDGNDRSGDGCSDRCRLEDGYACSRPGQTCTRTIVCGDAAREGTEQCDDGNTMPSDGCSAQCRTEADWICIGATGARSTCTYLVVCGDGIVNGGEACDDGGTANGDGCAANCGMIESGYACARPGFACRPVCGDGLTRGDEQCDDDATDDGDGCDSRCRLEDDTICTGGPDSPSVCHDTVCGQNGREGTEPCDDGNNDWGDGCTPACAKEPTCAVGQACTSSCGDGIRFPNEACDDGNTTNGDGCSSACVVEPGYQCTTAGDTPDLLGLPMVVRDFKPEPPFPVTADTGISLGHSDFQWGGYGNGDPDGNVANNWTNYPTLPGTGDAFTGGRTGNILAQGLVLGGGGGMEYGFVQTLLASDKKPVFQYEDADVGAMASPCPLAFGALIRNSQAFCVRQVQNRTSFSRWYHDVDAYNNTYDRTLPMQRCTVLTGACAGQTANTYVYDSNFNQADGTPYPTGAAFKGFWPVEDAPNVTKFTQGTGGPQRNFHFSSEVHHWFQFDTASLPTLIFTGDDDVWVFVKGTLVLDLGGTHPAVQGTVALDAAGNATVTRPTRDRTGTQTHTVNLGLVHGSIYEIIVFQAERNTNESNYRLSLQNFNLRKSTCTPVCGDAIVTPGEECDDGTDNTATPEYGKCTSASCTLGPFCGDGASDAAEQCDDGVNRSEWGQSGCAPGCTLPPRCGDGQIDAAFEECDLGAGNTATGYGGCTTSCMIGPSCGDGTVQNPPETCDDGVNDGFYGSCTPECAPGPRCGDGDLQEEWGEECDSNDPNCSNCRLGAQCGDGVLQTDEECDDGVNDGGYGECGPRCEYGPRCGDGVANGDEDCDDGDGNNTGGYGMCAPGCVYGPFCGDDRVQSAFEQCDDGNNRNGDGCSSACKNEMSVPR
jgi:fibro-slime domain-containing protein